MEMFSLFDFSKCFLNYMLYTELKSIERKKVYISILRKYTTNSCQSRDLRAPWNVIFKTI